MYDSVIGNSELSGTGQVSQSMCNNFLGKKGFKRVLFIVFSKLPHSVKQTLE